MNISNLFTSLSTGYSRLILILLVMSALAVGLAYVHHEIYTAGFDDGAMTGKLAMAEASNKGLQEYVQLNQKLITVEAKTKALESQVSGKLETVKAAGQVRVVTVEKIIHDNPEFAAIARPDDLYQLRQQSIADIAASAAEGKAAAAKLSGASLSRMRITDSDFGQYVGRDRSGRHNQPDPLAVLYRDPHSMVTVRF